MFTQQYWASENLNRMSRAHDRCFLHGLASVLLREDLATTMPPVDDPFGRIQQLSEQIELKRAEVAKLEAELGQQIESLNGQLAICIRKAFPKLQTILGNGRCQVRYRSKHLGFRPDLQTKRWSIDGADPWFVRRFCRAQGDHLGLATACDELARLVGGYFADHYKTLDHEQQQNRCSLERVDIL